MKANDGDWMYEPCEIGFRIKFDSGTVHTFRLRCDSSRQFISATDKQKDRANLCYEFCRSSEFEWDASLLVRAAQVLEEARNRRLDYIKKQK
jgi:hypothetical protein